jgi:chemotaxis protein MotA
LQATADALPALGIVAAVLGVIKTMGSIDQPPEILGKMIGGALVGTFLGVFLAYGIVGPFAARLRSVVEEDGHFYQLIREVLIANLHRHPANICVEVGRQNTPHHVRPSFGEVESALRGLRQEAA